jgi:hypothetical protein
MSRDIEELLRQGMERATEEIRLPVGLGGRAVRRYHQRRRTIRAAVAGGTAAATGAGLAVSGLVAAGGPPGQQVTGRSGVVTAAMVRHVATVSSAALAKSGHVRIVYASVANGKKAEAGTADITFSGKNSNDVSEERIPPNGKVVYRLVNGQAYYYGHGFTRRQPLRPRWVHDTSPGAAASISVKIPDPRKLLLALEPGARFVRAGYQVVDGVRLEHLRATQVSRLPRDLTSIGVPAAGEVTSRDGSIQRVWLAALDVWVDGHGVVRRIQISSGETDTAPVFTITRDRNGRTTVQRLIRAFRIAPHGKLAEEICIEGTVNRPQKIWHESCQKVEESLGNVSEHLVVAERSKTVVSVSFLDIGKPQTIAAPQHAVPVHGQG